jgi:hypothetical protein
MSVASVVPISPAMPSESIRDTPDPAHSPLKPGNACRNARRPSIAPPSAGAPGMGSLSAHVSQFGDTWRAAGVVRASCAASIRRHRTTVASHSGQQCRASRHFQRRDRTATASRGPRPQALARLSLKHDRRSLSGTPRGRSAVAAIAAPEGSSHTLTASGPATRHIDDRHHRAPPNAARATRTWNDGRRSLLRG